MRRILSFALCLLIILSLSATSFAEIDLSGMSFDELVALKDKINLAIWNCQEWQEVDVPQGVWKVGEDIPAGKWTITAKPKSSVMVSIGDNTVYDGTTVAAFVFEAIYAPDHDSFDENKNMTSWTVELEDGQYVGIENGISVFAPFSGKPSLGFK